jgi:hypothetical protein
VGRAVEAIGERHRQRGFPAFRGFRVIREILRLDLGEIAPRPSDHDRAQGLDGEPRRDIFSRELYSALIGRAQFHVESITRRLSSRKTAHIAGPLNQLV